MDKIFEKALEACRSMDTIAHSDNEREAYRCARTAIEGIRLAEGLSDRWQLYAATTGMVISNCSSLEDLHAVRAELRDIYGQWSDSLSQVWHAYGQTMIAAYRGDRAEIWLSFPVDSPPDGILGPGCRIDRVPVAAGHEYAVVCDKEKT